jgi:hypothetical protein
MNSLPQFFVSKHNLTQIFNVDYLTHNYMEFYSTLKELCSSVEQVKILICSDESRNNPISKDDKKEKQYLTCECGEVKLKLNKQHFNSKKHREWELCNNPDYKNPIVNEQNKITCNCGAILIRITDKHLNSKKHLKWLKSIEIISEKQLCLSSDDESNHEIFTQKKTNEKICTCSQKLVRIDDRHLRSKKHLKLTQNLSQNLSQKYENILKSKEEYKLDTES